MTIVGPLRDVVEKSTGTRNPAVQPDDEFTYVDVSAIDNQQKIINGARVLLGSEAPSRARKLLRANDVLVSTVRPNLNAVALVPSELDGQVGSTGFCVLRAVPSRALPEYIFYFVRSQRFVDALDGLVAGALYPAVTDSQVLDQELPLPSLSEQRRIVDLLSRAEGIVRLRRQAQQKAASIVPALYLDMFGDPATNSKNLPTEQLDNLCALVRGSSPRPQGDARFFGGPVPRLMIADITRDGVYVTPRIDSLTEEGATKSRPMKRGEVVMAVSGAVGLPAILAVDACIHDGFVGFRNLSREITPEFFYNYLAALRHFSRTQAVGATFQNLKTEQIRAWQVPRPSAAAQQRFAELAASARSIEVQQVAAFGKAEAMFQALLAQSFPGERQTPDFVADRGEAVPS